MKKKKLVEVQVRILLDRQPTTEELESLRKLFPDTGIEIRELWERETRVKDGKEKPKAQVL